MKKNEFTNNLSFVIRGSYEGFHPAYRESITFRLIRSIEKFFPDSFIYYVCWQNYTYIDNIRIQHPKVLVIEAEDPGSPEPIAVGDSNDIKKYKNNINRQIKSAVVGLKLIKTKYVCLVRSDFVFHNQNITRLYLRYKKHNYEQRYNLFDQPILSSFFGSVNSTKKLFSSSPNFPFHPSDLIHFGLTQDIFNYWNIPLMKESDFFYYLDHPRGSSRSVNNYDSGYLCKYLPEQYLFVNLLRKRQVLIQTEFTHMEDRPELYNQISQRYLLNSFFLANQREMGVSWQKGSVIHLKLPKFIFNRRSIILSSLGFHRSRYGFYSRKVSFPHKVLLSTSNGIHYILELLIVVIINSTSIYKKFKSIIKDKAGKLNK